MPIDYIALILANGKAFLSFIAGIHPGLLFVVFAVFLYASYKLFAVVMKAVYFAIAGAIFPLAMNYFFGAGIAITISNITFFATAGVGLYLMYHLAHAVYHVVGGIAWIGGKLVGSSESPTSPIEEEEEEFME